MIVLLLTTKNEADVLRLNLEHHLSWGIDHVVVCDNESTDDTADVVASFGDAATRLVFHDFAVRQKIRMRGLEQVKARYPGEVVWAGVSDTDEFHWAPGVTLPDLLAPAPADVVCATFHQKLYLPTELDAETGPVYARQLHRTTGPDSPLHASYREGKSFYRTSWLRKITHEHRSHLVPHEEWGPSEPTVHHYMIRDEDQFVQKVRRLTSWRERKGLHSKLWYHKLRRLVGIPLPPFVAGFKAEWWDVYRRGGEAGLRRYYRDEYRVQTQDVPGHIERGELVRDDAFAAYRRAHDRT